MSDYGSQQSGGSSDEHQSEEDDVPKKRMLRFNDAVTEFVEEDKLKARGIRFDDTPTEFQYRDPDARHGSADSPNGARSPDRDSEEGDDEKRSVGAESSINSIEANLYKRKMFSDAQRKFVKDVEKRVFKKDYCIMKAIANVEDEQQDKLINPDQTSATHDMNGRSLEADYSNLLDSVAAVTKSARNRFDSESFDWEDSDSEDSEGSGSEPSNPKTADRAMLGTEVREKFERKRRMEDDIDRAIRRKEMHLIDVLKKMSDEDLKLLMKDLNESIPMDKMDANRTVRSGKSRAQSMAGSRAVTRHSGGGASVKDQRYSRAHVIKKLQKDMSGSTLSTHTEFGNAKPTNAAALNYAFLRKRQFEVDLGLEVSTRDYELHEAVTLELSAVPEKQKLQKEVELERLMQTKQRVERARNRKNDAPRRNRKLVQRPWKPGGDAVQTSPTSAHDKLRARNKALALTDGQDAATTGRKGSQQQQRRRRQQRQQHMRSAPAHPPSTPRVRGRNDSRLSRIYGQSSSSAVGASRKLDMRPAFDSSLGVTQGVRTMSPRTAAANIASPIHGTRGPSVHKHRALKARPPPGWPSLPGDDPSEPAPAPAPAPPKTGSFLPAKVLALAALNAERSQQQRQPRPPDLGPRGRHRPPEHSRAPSHRAPTRPSTVPPGSGSQPCSFERGLDGLALRPPELDARLHVPVRPPTQRTPRSATASSRGRFGQGRRLVFASEGSDSGAVVVAGLEHPAEDSSAWSQKIEHMVLASYKGVSRTATMSGAPGPGVTARSAEAQRLQTLQRCTRDPLFVAMTEDHDGSMRGLEVRLRDFRERAKTLFARSILDEAAREDDKSMGDNSGLDSLVQSCDPDAPDGERTELHARGLALLDTVHDKLGCPLVDGAKFLAAMDEPSRVNAECVVERLTNALDFILALRDLARQLTDGPTGAVLKQSGDAPRLALGVDECRQRARATLSALVARCRALLPWRVNLLGALDSALRVAPVSTTGKATQTAPPKQVTSEGEGVIFAKTQHEDILCGLTIHQDSHDAGDNASASDICDGE